VTRADPFAAALGAPDSPRVPLTLGSTALAIIASALPQARQLHAADVIRQWAATRPDAAVVTAPPAAQWPFIHPLVQPLPAGALIVWVPDLHEAVINRQTASTRLVTTQAAYLIQLWFDAIADRSDVMIVATADPAVLADHAPEVLAQRGPFARAFLHHSPPSQHSPSVSAVRAESRSKYDRSSPQAHEKHENDPGMSAARALLASAMRARDAVERLALCVRALDEGRTAPALVATASVCMEVNDLDAAARDLDEALALAPQWAAAHYERGKLWLRVDDMVKASTSFRAAADLLPGFTPAWANLGAALGELDRPAEALAAFEHALALEPNNAQALNNVGVVRRELGRLPESEAAFRQVTQLTPDMAFGHYNLGHTLFLQGRFQAALSAYAEGQARDADHNPVQASRLALCKVATGDAAGALRELQRAVGALPREYRQQLLADTSAILWALVTQHPELTEWQPVHAWLAGELAKAGNTRV
jgi:tetratricopeptide (TPR) repeat protein